MSLLLYTAYLLVSALMLIQTMVLRRALRETVWLGRLLGNNGAPMRENGYQRLSVGSLAPRFRAETILGRTFSSDDFKGHRTILMFVSPEMKDDSNAVANLAAVMPALWLRADKSLYVVCTGETETCKSIVRDMLPLDLDSFALADPYGHVRRAFRVASSPTAIQMDTEGRILQYGFPLSMVDGDYLSSRALTAVDAIRDVNNSFSTTNGSTDPFERSR